MNCLGGSVWDVMKDGLIDRATAAWVCSSYELANLIWDRIRRPVRDQSSFTRARFNVMHSRLVLVVSQAV